MTMWTSLPMDAIPIQEFAQPSYRSDHLWYSHVKGQVYYVTKIGTCIVYVLPQKDLDALAKAYKKAFPTEDAELDAWMKMYMY